MYFVDNSSAVKVMPTPGVVFSTDPLWFTQGDSTNRPTFPGPDWFNIIQAEMLNVLSAAGMTPKKDDSTQLSQAIAALIAAAVGSIKTVPDIGELYFSTDLTDPNAKYPGTTWERFAEGLTLRTAKADGSDLNTTAGADSVTLSTDNLPAHSHAIGGDTGSNGASTPTTSAFDHGSPSSTGAGGHTHTLLTDANASEKSDYVQSLLYGGMVGVGGITGGGMTYTQNTGVSTQIVGSVGDHAHVTGIGAHSHTVAIAAHSHSLPAATGGVGSGAGVSILQKSIMVAVWVRTA